MLNILYNHDSKFLYYVMNLLYYDHLNVKFDKENRKIVDIVLTKTFSPLGSCKSK